MSENPSVVRGPETVVIGTAGHIDHGKTALVHALTGVDTDRLEEERKRGMTIELGFAPFPLTPELHASVVDVPGHEDFIRTMVAGASGVDMVLLVVAADEGAMPQTREHLDIVRLLGVSHIVVALTKTDRVDAEWLELARDDADMLMTSAGYEDVPIVPTSIHDSASLGELRRALEVAARNASADRSRRADDLLRVPVDRSFAIHGTGTVVTGTVRSGTVRVGDSLRVMGVGRDGQEEVEARVRRLQCHGEDREVGRVGERIAVALVGVSAEEIPRGAVLVSDPAWSSSWMVDLRIQLLSAESGFSDGGSAVLESRDRVRVLHDTREVMARVVPLDGSDGVPVGGRGLVQLRLEAPLTMRAGDRVVLRRYSPLMTIGGGEIVDPFAEKTTRLTDDHRAWLESISTDPAVRSLEAMTLSRAERGVSREELPVRLGRTAHECGDALNEADGGIVDEGGRLFSVTVLDRWADEVIRTVDERHRDRPSESGLPRSEMGALLPGWPPPEFGQAVLHRCLERGELEAEGAYLRRPGFRPELTDSMRAELDELEREMDRRFGFVDIEVGAGAERAPERSAVTAFQVSRGAWARLDSTLYARVADLERLVDDVQTRFSGRSGLGPADFREVVDLSRAQLLSLLAYLDAEGVTRRDGEGRSVQARPVREPASPEE